MAIELNQAASSEKTRQRTQKSMRKLVMKTIITSVALVVLLMYLMPFIYSFVTSLKTKQQVTDINAPLLPSQPERFSYNGKEVPVVLVPLDEGMKKLALIEAGRQLSVFIDPQNLEAGEISWEGSWRTLKPVYSRSLTWSNFPKAFETINFLRMLGYTLMYSIVTTIASTFSAAIVAYGFSRFRFPYQNLLFLILISTIILPPQVTLVPTYAFFFALGWIGTWLPLIVPTFFSNAYNVFLLRQYFLTIPTEIEDAASIDGAGPIQTFFRIILPQSIPALIAVSLFHFFFAWNDFFGPLIYLAGNLEAQPISTGLHRFNGLYGAEPQLIQAASILTMIIPLLMFFFAQRYFMQGIVVTGVEK